MSDFLFKDFTPTSPSAWKQKIQVDLRGADYNETLLFKTEEGLVVKPFYTKEDRKNLTTKKTAFQANICQSIFVDNEKIANTIAVNALQKGVTAIEFIAIKLFDYKILLKEIDLKNTVFYFRIHFLDAAFIKELSTFINSKKSYFQVDIIGNLATTGNWFINLKEDHEAFKTLVNQNNNSVGIDGSLYQNAGANSVQQLAYTLSHANEYLNHLGASSASKFHFTFSVSGNYFFEIAKLRAFRILWTALLKEYEIENTETHLFVQPSLRNKTIYDYNVNLLRTSSECMSALLGGANTVCNLAYDSLYHKKNEFGERIARNQLLILQQESNLQEANTLANGAYYIESITAQLAEKALQLFKEIEKSGGFLKQLKAGTIQRKIAESAQKEQKQFDNGELVLLGSNKQPNNADRMKGELELYPFSKSKTIKTLLAPILPKRLAESYEKQRIEAEGNE